MTIPATERTTPKAARVLRKARLARVFAAACDGSPVSKAEIAAALGVDVSKVKRWADDETGETLPTSDLEALPEEVALPILRELARVHGFTLAQLQLTADPVDEVGMLANAAITTTGEAIRAAACVERDTSKGALEDVVRESTEAIEALAALRARAIATLERPTATPLRRAK